MKDRYLFRGKRLDNGEWVIGNLTQDTLGHSWILPIEAPYSDEEEDVHSSTIGQCTGLKDKNGKLIFEGDKLKGKGEVEFFNGGFRIHTGIDVMPIDYCVVEESAIIGNIHEDIK